MAGAISLLLIFLSSTSHLFAQDYPDEIIDTTGIVVETNTDGLDTVWYFGADATDTIDEEA